MILISTSSTTYLGEKSSNRSRRASGSGWDFEGVELVENTELKLEADPIDQR